MDTLDTLKAEYEVAQRRTAKAVRKYDRYRAFFGDSHRSTSKAWRERMDISQQEHEVWVRLMDEYHARHLAWMEAIEARKAV